MEEIQVKFWETEEDREMGESCSEFFDTREEAIEYAESLFYRQSVAFIEVIEKGEIYCEYEQ